MIKLISLIAVVFCLFGAVASAQTNLYYHAGETVVELAPTYSSQNIINPDAANSFGYSFEVEHWTSPYIGAGLEFGNYDYRNLNYGMIDHIAVMADIRYVPFPQDPLFGRLAIGGKTGAETFFQDGTKDIELGVGGYWTFTKKQRLEIDVVQHLRTNPAKDGQTFRAAIQFIF